jgi:hypothetical protein
MLELRRMRIAGALLALVLLPACPAHPPLRPDPPLQAEAPRRAAPASQPDAPPRAAAPRPAPAAPDAEPEAPEPASAPVVADGTAWGDWLAAGRLLKPTPQRSALNVLGTLLQDRMTKEEEPAPLQMARALLQDNQRALDRAVAAVQRTRCVYPAATLRAARDRAALHVQALAHLLLLRAVVAARSGDSFAAVADLTRAFATARLLLGCQGPPAFVGAAQGIDELGLRFGRWLARRPIDDRTRAALVTALEGLGLGETPVWAALEAAGRQSVKELEIVELQSAPAQAELVLAHARQAHLHGQLAKLVDHALDELLAKKTLAAADRKKLEALQAKLGAGRIRTSRKARTALTHLLQSQPTRFVAAPTRTRLQAGLDGLGALVRARQGGWEQAVSDVGQAALAELKREPGPALLVCAQPALFRDGVPEPIRGAFAQTENLLGRYQAAVALHQLARAVGTELARARELEAQRAVLLTGVALLRYEAKHRVLPRTLTPLTTGGLLKRLPSDPHAGGPLRYRPTARRVWSVGADKKDDGGAHTDTVFRLPPPTP